MNVALGGDYRSLFRDGPPAGLVSDPPDYSRCTKVSATIPRVAGKPKPTASQGHLKCHQLYAAIKQQALNLVLASLWTREGARELGIRTPSESEVSARVRAYIAHAALYTLIVQNNLKWKARTSCSRGYRSSWCKQYLAGSEIKPTPNIVLEYFRKGIG